MDETWTIHGQLASILAVQRLHHALSRKCCAARSIGVHERPWHINVPKYIHVNPERSFGGTNEEPPSEASKLRKGGPGVLLRKISKTYIANGAIYVIPELYL